MKKPVLKSLLACGVLFLYFVCTVRIGEQRAFFREKENYQAVYGEERSTYADFLTMQDNYPFVEGCYTVSSGQLVEGILCRDAEVTVIEESVDSNLLFPSFNVLYAEDDTGCLLDRGTMYILFGTAADVGQTVLYRGKEYTVRGIIETDLPIIVISGQTVRKDYPVDGFILNTESETYKNQYAGLLQNSYKNITQFYYLTEYVSLKRWVETPSEWSDFEFWGQWFQTAAGRAEHLLFENKDILEQLFVRESWRLIGYYMIWAFITVYACFFMGRRLLKKYAVICKKPVFKQFGRIIETIRKKTVRKLKKIIIRLKNLLIDKNKLQKREVKKNG